MNDLTSMPNEPSDFISPVAGNLGYLLRRVSSLVMATLGSLLAPTELRPVEATILMLINANSACTQSDLGRSLGIKRANMVPLISRLGEKGLIEKKRADGRSQSLSLTKKGQVSCRAVLEITAAVESRIETWLHREDIAYLRESLETILKNGAADMAMSDPSDA